MIQIQQRASTAVALAVVLLAGAPACAPVGELLGDGGYPGGRSSVVTGEVRSVDARRGHLQVRDDRSNRNVNLRYDGRTRVTSGQRQYPASSLDRGDYVRVSISYDRSGNPWADRVEVQNSRRGSAGSRVQRVEGTVRAVDIRRGHFTLDQSRAGSIRVHVPQRMSSSDARRFDRLRRGDRVRAEVRIHGRNQAELVRFR